MGTLSVMSNRTAAATGEEPRVRGARAREPLWRDVLGLRLRELRHDRGETLDDIAHRAGVSPQYLSEMERGLKEPSSEMIAAVAGALETTLGDLARDIAEQLTPAPVSIAAAPTSAGPVALALAA